VTAPRPPRVGALDLLRGFTVAAMIVVNNPGNWNRVFPSLTHAAWNGVTFADLIFPSFIVIMGVAIALTLDARRPDAARGAVYQRVLSRSCLLILMGLVLNAAAAWPAVGALRIPGVLQRIGLAYLLTALIVLNAGARMQMVIGAGLMVLHWLLLTWPLGQVARLLEPGENIAASIDRWLFGIHTLTPRGDPEGALGLLTTVATALFGVWVGRLVREDAQRRVTTAERAHWGIQQRLLAIGTAAVLLGAAWSVLLPLNKSLWTASFALLASGTTTLALVVFARLDGGRSRAVAPLLWLGTNPLAIYFLSELCGDLLQREWLWHGGQPAAPKDLIYWNGLVPLLGDGGGPWSSLVYALGYTLLWVGVAGLMRWRGVRLRV
jgi:predicted acyltransferase